MQGLVVGSIVHYVLSNGQHRPAIVVRDWSSQMSPDASGRLEFSFEGVVNLQVFADGSNDAGVISGNVSAQGAFWATSVHYDPQGTTHHTWHWPEQA